MVGTPQRCVWRGGGSFATGPKCYLELLGWGKLVRCVKLLSISHRLLVLDTEVGKEWLLGGGGEAKTSPR